MQKFIKFKNFLPRFFKIEKLTINIFFLKGMKKKTRRGGKWQ